MQGEIKNSESGQDYQKGAKEHDKEEDVQQNWSRDNDF